jgi:hypothetical protein
MKGWAKKKSRIPKVDESNNGSFIAKPCQLGAIDDIWRDKTLNVSKPELTSIVVGKR